MTQQNRFNTCIFPGLRIHSAITQAFASAEVKEAMAKQGNSINISSPQAALTYFKSETVKYAALVKRAGVVAQ